MRVFFISRRFLWNMALLGLICCLVGAMKLIGDTAQAARLASAVLGDSPGDIYMQGEEQAVSLLIPLDREADKQLVGQLLGILADNGARASFFVSGQLAEEEPELLRSILAGGHELGNLGYDDTNPADLNRWEQEAAIAKTNELVAKASGAAPRLYLPLFGVTEEDTRLAAADCGLTFVLGSVDPGDWRPETTPEEVIAAVLSQTEPGSFITIGCGESVLAALDTILKELAALDLPVITVSENLNLTNKDS